TLHSGAFETAEGLRAFRRKTDIDYPRVHCKEAGPAPQFEPTLDTRPCSSCNGQMPNSFSLCSSCRAKVGEASRSNSRLGMMTLTYKNILTEIEEQIGIVRLNRPQVLNALSHELMDELVKALEEFDRDDNIRVIILTGNDKAFAAGADIKEMAEET